MKHFTSILVAMTFFVLGMKNPGHAQNSPKLLFGGKYAKAIVANTSHPRSKTNVVTLTEFLQRGLDVSLAFKDTYHFRQGDTVYCQIMSKDNHLSASNIIQQKPPIKKMLLYKQGLFTELETYEGLIPFMHCFQPQEQFDGKYFPGSIDMPTCEHSSTGYVSIRDSLGEYIGSLLYYLPVAYDEPRPALHQSVYYKIYKKDNFYFADSLIFSTPGISYKLNIDISYLQNNELSHLRGQFGFFDAGFQYDEHYNLCYSTIVHTKLHHFGIIDIPSGNNRTINYNGVDYYYCQAVNEDGSPGDKYYVPAMYFSTYANLVNSDLTQAQEFYFLSSNLNINPATAGDESFVSNLSNTHNHPGH